MTPLDWTAPVILTGCVACRVRWLGALTVCPGCAADLGRKPEAK
jgi:hypothetical protein